MEGSVSQEHEFKGTIYNTLGALEPNFQRLPTLKTGNDGAHRSPPCAQLLLRALLQQLRQYYAAELSVAVLEACQRAVDS
jgi:hypothetical protein